MEYTGQTFFKTKLEDKTQEDGAQDIDVSASLYLGIGAKRYWQVQVSPSAVPTGGELEVSVKAPGADGYQALDTAIDLTGSDLLLSFVAIAESIRITPSDFDADKTYSVFLAATT